MTPEAQTQSKTPSTGTWVLIERADPEGTYCCHPTPKQLREWTAEYNRRERGFSIVNHEADRAELERRRSPFTHYRKIDGVEVRLVSTPSPAIYPSLLPEEADEDRRYLDSDDYWTLQAYQRYSSLLKRVEKFKRDSDRNRRAAIRLISDSDLKARVNEKLLAAMHEKLATFREEWKEIEAETLRSWDEVQSHAELVGRDGERRLNREAAEVAYCHRDPSDWQILAEDGQPEAVIEAVESAKDKRKLASAVELDLDGFHVVDLSDEDELSIEDVRYDMMCRELLAGVRNAWRRLFSELGADADHGRIVTRWENVDGRWIAGTSVSRDEFIARKIHAAGDELLGLQKALAGVRYRIEKSAAKKRRIAEFAAYRNAA